MLATLRSIDTNPVGIGSALPGIAFVAYFLIVWGTRRQRKSINNLLRAGAIGFATAAYCLPVLNADADGSVGFLICAVTAVALGRRVAGLGTIWDLYLGGLVMFPLGWIVTMYAVFGIVGLLRLEQHPDEALLLLGAFVAWVTAFVWMLAIAHRSLRARKLAMAGFCAACGYDLRSSPDRCPECGRFRHRLQGEIV